MAVALIVIGSLLIILNLIAIRKEKKSFSSTVNDAEIDMSEFKVEIGKMRKEFAETILELQSEIEQLKIIIEDKDISEKKEEIEYKEKDNNNEKNNVMVNEIEKLFSKGFTIEEVSEKLNMGKGEILLIKELYLK